MVVKELEQAIAFVLLEPYCSYCHYKICTLIYIYERVTEFVLVTFNGIFY